MECAVLTNSVALYFQYLFLWFICFKKLFLPHSFCYIIVELSNKTENVWRICISWDIFLQVGRQIILGVDKFLTCPT